MKKKIKVLVVSSSILFLVWYFLLKQSDYTITFNVKAATGTVFQGVQEWTAAQAINNQENYFYEMRFK
jgi:hypothetical protein